MFAIYALTIYGFGFAILGVITLACIPKLRLTFPNLLVFVLGGFIGMFAFMNAVFWLLHGLVELLGIHFHGEVPHGDVFFWLLVAVGATLGGACLVWLKMRLQSRRGKNKGL